jgi:hypothetical protein
MGCFLGAIIVRRVSDVSVESQQRARLSSPGDPLFQALNDRIEKLRRTGYPLSRV